MIIVRVPLRISFVGGGSDLPAFYERAVGQVISTAIDKYIFIAINKKFDGRFRVSYSVTENVNKPEEIENTRVRAALLHFVPSQGLEIVSVSDVPGRGTGLGSSSSFTVGLIHGLACFLGKKEHRDKRTLAETACHLEQKILGEPLGKQDQYAAAYGGFNLLKFYPEKVTVQPIKIPKNKLDEFRAHFLVFYAGGPRDAKYNSGLLTKNLNSDEKKFLAQKRLAEWVTPFKNKLLQGDFKSLGEIIHEGWLLKRSTSPVVSNEMIDELYKIGRRNGAWGGKLLGAGGGGFIFFLAPPKNQKKLRRVFSKLRELPVGFDYRGSTVIFNRYERT